MQINRNNYGAFFLDYAENTLDEAGRENLARFLEQNPDLQDEFFEFESISLSPDTKIVFNQKTKLKHLEILDYGPINQENYETWIIAFLEGDLSKKELLVFEAFKSKNVLIEKEIAAFKLTYLKSKTSIVFPDKELIKRNLEISFKRKIIWYSASVAAVLMIAFGVFRLLEVPISGTTNQQARIIEEPINPKNTQSETKTEIAKNEIVNQNRKIKNPLEDLSANKKEPLENPVRIVASNNQVGTNETEKYKNRTNNPGSKIPNAGSKLIAVNQSVNPDLNVREELSGSFDDMILRDAIIAFNFNPESRKTAIGRVLSNVGHKIINKGNHPDQEPALINNIANRGKETFLAFADGLPIYRSFKKDTQNKTVFAVGDNFSIGLSRQKEKNGLPSPDNR